MVTPFGPKPAWVREYLWGSGAEASGKVSGKDFARCSIAGRILTIPVEGGASVLKRNGSNPVLSEHGKWRREHLGAWQAAYGKSPYYAHLMPEIADAYADSEGKSLEEFNSELLAIILNWIDLEGARAARTAQPGSELARIRVEAEEEVKEDLSIFDAIFRLGKRVSLAL